MSKYNNDDHGLFFYIVMAIVVIIGEIFLAMMMWDIVIIPIFGVKSITFWQMAGLKFFAYLVWPSSSSK